MAAKKTSNKNRILVMAVMLVLTSCGVLGGAVFWAGNSLESRARSLPFHVDEARRLGLVTTTSELRVLIKDSKDDAYPQLKEAFRIWRKMPAEDSGALQALARRALRGLPSGREPKALDAEIARHPDLLKRIRSAAARTECSVPEVETWRHKRLHEYGAFQRDAVRILAGLAVTAGARHDVRGAEGWLREAIGLSRHLSAQPSYLGMMRKAAAELEIQRAIERVIYANGNRPATMAEMLGRLEPQFGPMMGAVDVLRCEPALMLEALSDEKRTGLENVPAGQLFADVGKAGALEIFNRYYRKFPSDPEDQDEAARILIAMDEEGEDTPFFGSYVKGYDSIVPLLRDLLARRRLAKAALDYLVSGSLENLPADPHTAEPMKSKETSDGLIIYSVGRDKVDNQGQDRIFRGKVAPTYDLIFRLPKSP